MRIGVLAGSEWCIPLLMLLKNSNAEVFLFAEVEDRNSFIPVRQLCNATGIKVQEGLGKPENLYPWIEQVRPDLIFIIGYKYLVDINRLPQNLSNLVFNIHFGPLPSFRGPNPIFWQLRKGMQVIGVTIHHVNMKFDQGKVVWYKEIPRLEYFTYGLVNQICSQLILEGVVIILQHLSIGKPLPEPIIRNESGYYKRPVLKDVSVDWQKMDAKTIVHLVQACNPWNKGAIILYGQMDIKLLDVTIVPQVLCPKGGLPGTILDQYNKLYISTCDRKVLDVHMLTIGGTFVPARHAEIYGLKEGIKFS